MGENFQNGKNSNRIDGIYGFASISVEAENVCHPFDDLVPEPFENCKVSREVDI